MLPIGMNPYTAHNHIGHYNIQSKALFVSHYILYLQMRQYRPFPQYCNVMNRNEFLEADCGLNLYRAA